jgi:hypothetical protein
MIMMMMMMMTAGRRETPEIAVVGEVLYHLASLYKQSLLTGQTRESTENKGICYDSA